MNIFRLCLFLFLFLKLTYLSLSVSAVWAQDLYQPKWIDTPDWVQPMDLPPINPSRLELAKDGVFYVLDDRHLRWVDGELMTYFRLATKVLARSGLEDTAALRLRFDAPLEELDIIDISVRRGDQVISYRHNADIKVFRREDDLEGGIVNGELTAYFDIPDVQVGDVVDWSVMYRTTPYFDNETQYSTRVKLEWSLPTGGARYRVDWPEGIPFHLKDTLKNATKTVEPVAGGLRHTWVELDAEPLVFEKNMPYEYAWRGGIELSGIDSWAQVVETLLPHYQSINTVPSAWVPEIEAIRTSSQDPAVRAIKAVRLVQEKIRYVGIEVGTGGYLARSPEFVVANGFGDCKDKSVLLQAILQALDVHSELVLVDTDNGFGLKDRLPTLFAFNHMIVRAKVNGKWIWMDPTLHSQAGDLEHFVQPNYGYGLPLVAGANAMIEMDPGGSNLLALNEVQRFDFRKGRGVLLTVNTTFTLAYADWRRNKIAQVGRAETQQKYFDYYKGQYPGLKIAKPMAIQDDFATNTLVLTEFYELSEVDLREAEMFTDFGFVAGSSIDILREVQPDRMHPALMKVPYSIQSKVEVNNAPIEFTVPEAVKIENEYFNFSYAGKSRPRRMTLDWTLDTGERVMAASDAKMYVEAMDEAEDTMAFYWSLTPEETGFWGRIIELLE